MLLFKWDISSLFSYFFIFPYSEQFTDDWIQTRVFWCRKEPLCWTFLQQLLVLAFNRSIKKGMSPAQPFYSPASV